MGKITVSFEVQTTITIAGAIDPESGESESVSLSPPYGVVFPFVAQTNLLCVTPGTNLSTTHFGVSAVLSSSNGVIITQDESGMPSEKTITFVPYEDNFLGYLTVDSSVNSGGGEN